MPGRKNLPRQRHYWFASGDINAFFGLMLDNVANLVLAVSLLSASFGFPASFALRYMVPGTALGVLVGDLAFTWMAVRLAARTGREGVTAMPLGLDTPSNFGMVFFVIGPAFLSARGRGLDEHASALYAWHIGICCIVASGIVKLLCAPLSGWIRQVLPRAGLLGSLAAIALVLIGFLPLVDILEVPLVGMLALAVILTTLVARIETPWRLPGTVVALVLGGAIFYLLRALGLIDAPAHSQLEMVWLPTEWLSALTFQWPAALADSLRYLPIVLPFALATVVGGIDCTESAIAAGDEYSTGRVIAVEGLATVIAGLCGGVVQTTPYIGHPAYKAMGGRAGYTLATALVIGSAGVLGYFGLFYEWIPKPVIFPILVFVGLEITAQSFHATPVRHYPAVALACLPALAYLVTLLAGDAKSPLPLRMQILHELSGGFVITSLVWASALAALIDRRLSAAAMLMLVGAVCSLFGVIHSPLPGSPLVVPWDSAAMAHGLLHSPLGWSAAYALAALLFFVWGVFLRHVDVRAE